jgi:uncharacterized membrane protein YfhO
MQTIKNLFYIALWVLILSWFFGFGWAITIIIVLSVLIKVFEIPTKERKTKVPRAAKLAASAYIGYKSGKKIGKW